MLDPTMIIVFMIIVEMGALIVGIGLTIDYIRERKFRKFLKKD